MATTLTARQGDTLDLLLWRELALGAAALPAVLAANAGLAGVGPELPAGTSVTVPDAAVSAADTAPLIQLWD